MMKEYQHPKITERLKCQGSGLINVNLLFMPTVANFQNLRVKRLKLAQSIRGLERATNMIKVFFFFLFFFFFYQIRQDTWRTIFQLGLGKMSFTETEISSDPTTRYSCSSSLALIYAPSFQTKALNKLCQGEPSDRNEISYSWVSVCMSVVSVTIYVYKQYITKESCKFYKKNFR